MRVCVCVCGLCWLLCAPLKIQGLATLVIDSAGSLLFPMHHDLVACAFRPLQQVLKDIESKVSVFDKQRRDLEAAERARQHLTQSLETVRCGRRLVDLAVLSALSGDLYCSLNAQAITHMSSLSLSYSRALSLSLFLSFSLSLFLSRSLSRTGQRGVCAARS